MNIRRTLEGNDVSKLMYKTYANKLTKVKSLAKKLFFAQELTNCKGIGRKMWEVIKTLIPLNSTKKFRVTPSELEIDGSLIQDPKLIADKFGKHFNHIAASITDSISPSTHSSDFKRFLPNRVTDSIFMQPTDPAEVFSTIMSLNSSKSCGVDDDDDDDIYLFSSNNQSETQKEKEKINKYIYISIHGLSK